MKTPEQLVSEAVEVMTGRKPKPKADPNVPTIYFHAPPVPTGKEFADAVVTGKGWKTLQQAANETAEAKRLQKLSEKYELTEIPRPIFEDTDL